MLAVHEPKLLSLCLLSFQNEILSSPVRITARERVKIMRLRKPHKNNFKQNFSIVLEFFGSAEIFTDF